MISEDARAHQRMDSPLLCCFVVVGERLVPFSLGDEFLIAMFLFKGRGGVSNSASMQTMFVFVRIWTDLS